MPSIKQFQPIFAFCRRHTGEGCFGVILNAQNDNKINFVRMAHCPTTCPTYGHVINGATCHSVTRTGTEALPITGPQP